MAYSYTEAMRAAGLVPISFEAPAPTAGCPGGVMKTGPHRGKTIPLCLTCGRPSGNELEPAALIRGGAAECLNFHEASVRANPNCTKTAIRGGPDGGAVLATAQTGAGLL